MQHLGMNVKVKRSLEWQIKALQTGAHLKNHSELVQMALEFCIQNQLPFNKYCGNVHEAQQETEARNET